MKLKVFRLGDVSLSKGDAFATLINWNFGVGHLLTMISLTVQLVRSLEMTIGEMNMRQDCEKSEYVSCHKMPQQVPISLAV